MKCISRDRNNKCCRFTIIVDTKFCKNHQYMNDYSDDMLTNLSLCSGCKKMYYMNGKTKICETCQERSKKNKIIAREKIVLCLKDGCKFKRSVLNEYCNLHQLQVFINETKNSGKKLCYNHNRGCRTQLDESYNFTRCQECLGIDRKNDKERRDRVKVENEGLIPAAETQNIKGCTSCCKYLPIDQFKSILHPDIETLNCLSCRQNNTKNDLNRDKEHRNKIARINESKPERIEVKKQWKENNYEKVAEYCMNSRQHKIERVGVEEYLKDNAGQAQS
jgi:hypothetical protein